MDGKNLGTEAGLGIGAQLWAIEAARAPLTSFSILPGENGT
jgi:hypothetical protein